MFGDRLTDFLNGQERFRVHHVTFQSLDDGHTWPRTRSAWSATTCSPSSRPVPVARNEQRVRLEEARMQLSIGPYIILGRLHLQPGRTR